MSIKRIVICDTEMSYVDRLLMKLQQKKDRNLQYIGITKEADFQGLDDGQSLYLMAEPFWKPAYIEGLKERVMLLGSGYVPKWLMGYPVIDKYQDYQGIVRSIFGSDLWNGFFSKDNQVFKSSLHITGIYAPSKHPDTVYYGISYAKHLEKKTLFVPILQNGFYFFSEQYEVQSDLLDVMYLMEMKEEEFDLRGFIYHAFGVELILPPYVSGAAGRLKREQIVKFLELVQMKTDYEEVVLCFDCLIEEFFELFDSFSKKILLEWDVHSAMLTQRQFEENIKMYYGKEREDTFIRVKLQETHAYDPDQIGSKEAMAIGE
ncbi:MAG: hypothetical protein K6G01_07675 [Eubacterium sp.]|nr:hypothetical protein [Eubacterium sp.]